MYNTLTSTPLCSIQFAVLYRKLFRKIQKKFYTLYIPVYHYHHSNNGIRTGEIKYINANWYPYGNNILQ